MIEARVFDPAMCCSTGICGPSVDPELVRFAADLEWLKTRGVSVERFNLSQQPAAFAEDAVVKAALEARGEAGLPLVKVNGQVMSSGGFPSRDELAAWVGLRSQVESQPSGEEATPTSAEPRGGPRAEPTSSGRCGPSTPTAKSGRCC